jgi:hypothetical protein
MPVVVVLKRMTAAQFCEYLREKHGIVLTTKALANKRSKRLPPYCKYFGATPMYEPEEGDRYAREDAFTDTSPHARAAERRKAAGLPPPKGIGRPRKKSKTEASERPRSPPAE